MNRTTTEVANASEVSAMAFYNVKDTESFLAKCEEASRTGGTTTSNNSPRRSQLSNRAPGAGGQFRTTKSPKVHEKEQKEENKKDSFSPIICMDYQMVSKRRTLRNQSTRL